MSTESRAVLRELHIIIEKLSTIYAESLSTKIFSQFALSQLDDKDLRTLEKISFTNQQVDSVKKLIISYGREVVFSSLCLIDGVADTEYEIPEISMINRKTNKEINDEYLHDEFVEMMEE